MDYNLELPKEFEEMDLLHTLSSPKKSDMGIMVLGENYSEGVEWPIVRTYLISIEEEEWDFVEELQAFTFLNFGSAKRFVEELPSMSAIDLLLLLKRQQAPSINNSTMQW